jgi:hypothetical protein
MSNLQKRDGCPVRNDDMVKLHSDDSNRFLQVLTKYEQDNTLVYRQAWPGQVWQVNQHPETSFASMSSDWGLQSLTKSMGPLLADHAGSCNAVEPPVPRFIFGSE